MIDLRVWQPTINGSTMSSCGFTLSEAQEAIDEVKLLRCELAKYKKRAMPEAKKILKNGDYMTVLWADGTKTIVKRAADEPQSDYAAFTAAVGIKAYGSNSALKRIVAGAEEQGKKKKKKSATNAGKQQNEGEILRALEDIKEGNREAYRK